MQPSVIWERLLIFCLSVEVSCCAVMLLMQAGSTCCRSATQRSISAACLWLTGKVQFAVDEQSIAQNALQPELTSVPVPADRERRGVMRKIVISKHSRIRTHASWTLDNEWGEDSDWNVGGMRLNHTYPRATPDPNLSQTHLEGVGVSRGELRWSSSQDLGKISRGSWRYNLERSANIFFFL